MENKTDILIDKSSIKTDENGYHYLETDTTVELPSTGLFAIEKDRNLFVTTAGGNGMINAGIKNNDTLIIEKRKSLNNEEIGVMWYEGKMYVKTYRQLADGTIELSYEDDHTDSIKVPADSTEFFIFGRLYAVYRKIDYSK